MEKEYKAHPFEFFHGEAIRQFHIYMKANNLEDNFIIDGIMFNEIIAAAKNETKKKYPEELEVPVTGVADEEDSILNYDLSGIDAEKKEMLLKCFTEVTAKQALSLFMALGLKTHIETKVINDATGDKFILSFRKILDTAVPSTPIDTLDKELFDPQICSICKINIDAIPTHPMIKAVDKIHEDTVNKMIDQADKEEKCSHDNTELQAVRCDVCRDCGQIIETDV